MSTLPSSSPATSPSMLVKKTFLPSSEACSKTADCAPLPQFEPAQDESPLETRIVLPPPRSRMYMSSELSLSPALSASVVAKNTFSPEGTTPPGTKLASAAPLPQPSTGQEASPWVTSVVVLATKSRLYTSSRLSPSAATSGSLVEKKTTAPSAETPS